VSDLPHVFASWDEGREQDFASHVQAIAQARYVVRRVLRIIEEQAKTAGLQPLQHQALLQVYGAPELLPVFRLAERLDIDAALASRLVRQLEEAGLVERVQGNADRRVTAVRATPAGIERLRAIDESVHVHVRYFQSQLSHGSKLGALATFAFYVGLDSDQRLADYLRDSVSELDAAPRAASRPRGTRRIPPDHAAGR
jgi:DNA-binding MarR family transcriptional regulator